jgi:hypothetical protein
LVGGASLAAVGLVLYQPQLASALKLQPLDAASVVMAVVCGLSGLTVGLIFRRLLPLRQALR